MIYCMSDIHGCMDALEKRLNQVDLTGDNKLILLGDYIDYGEASGQVLERIQALQTQYGTGKVVVLKGNHEDMFLDWIDEFKGEYSPKMEASGFDVWLREDERCGCIAYRSLVSKEGFAEYDTYASRESAGRINHKAVSVLLKEQEDLIRWLKGLPLFYETETQIFVHAGVDEEAEDLWKHGTPDKMFVWKYPATTGPFCKDIIAGHVGTHEIAKDDAFHGIFFDGESHYYIDGTVYRSGQLNLLAYDEKTECYYEILSDGTPKSVLPGA